MAEADSLFDYTGVSGTYISYNDVAFEPMFFNPNLTVMFPDDANRLQAVQLCYNATATSADSDTDPTARRECYYDFAATADSALAEQTIVLSTQIEDDQQQLGGYNILQIFGNQAA